MSTTTVNNSFSILEKVPSATSEATAPKKETLKNEQNTYSILAPVILVAGCWLISPPITTPTKSTQNYSYNKTYALTGQQTNVEFELGIADVIRSYQDYLPNWDGYEGITPSIKTIENTIQFFEDLPHGMREPRPGISGDGEISLFWENHGIFVDIGFTGDDSYTFYALDQDGIEYMKDVVSLDKPMPSAIKKLIAI